MKNTNKVKSFLVVFIFVAIGTFLYFSTFSKSFSNHSKTQLFKEKPLLQKSFLPKYSTTTNNMLKDDIGISLEDLPLPSPSQLSPEDYKRAVSFFEAQRENWISLRSISASFHLLEQVKNDETGEYETMNRQNGQLTCLITPLAKQEKNNYVAIKVRLDIENSGVTLLKDNMCDIKTAPLVWATDGSVLQLRSRDTSLLRRAIYDGFPLDDMFMMVRHMHNSYHDELLNNQALPSKEAFFSKNGIPYRRCSNEEREGMFNGEDNYLFLPGNFYLKYWFSAETGEFRAFDVDEDKSPGNVGKKNYYEKYISVSGKNEDIKFPTKLTFEVTKKGKKFRRTVELEDVRINDDIPTESLQISKNATSL